MAEERSEYVAGQDKDQVLRGTVGRAAAEGDAGPVARWITFDFAIRRAEA